MRLELDGSVVSEVQNTEAKVELRVVLACEHSVNNLVADASKDTSDGLSVLTARIPECGRTQHRKSVVK